jgi:N-acetylneuraminate synthase
MTLDKTLVIAEAGVNHNGCVKRAKALIEVAKEAGADIVKFQTFRAETLVTRSAPKATYQAELTGAMESQFDMLKRLELTHDEFLSLAQYCQEIGIEFLSTAFDEGSLDFLVKQAGLKRIKMPSGEVTNGPFLAMAARTQLPIILSTGMATLEEIEMALDVIAWARGNNDPRKGVGFQGCFSRADKEALGVSVLHCTTEYPAAFEGLNLTAIQSLRNSFQLVTGFSDHSEGILAPVAAVAMGAKIIEKHFTLSRSLPGPDHRASLEPDELKQMIANIRNIETMLGTGYKNPTVNELANAKVARKSLVARCSIKKGERLTEENVAIKRPGTGISPMEWWKVIGTESARSYESDELIDTPKY